MTLPYTFRWTPRPGHPDESYQFILVESTFNNQFTGPNVGYVGEYTLQSVEPPWIPGMGNYSWTVAIYGADGSTGTMYDTRRVRFTNVAQ